MNRRIAGVIGTALLVLVGWWGFANAQNFKDWYTLRGYTPPAEIQALADRASLSEEGERYFFVSKPELNDREQFNLNCDFGEQTIILGCYSAQRIYIFNIADPQLDGVKEVTAAHEMLHAAYDRLSLREQQKVDSYVSAAYEQVTDKRVKDQVDQYRRSDPSVLANELHSILATEVETLTPELEEYYKQYFEDRQKVVALSNQYETVFVRLENETAALEQQIEDLKADLADEEANLTALQAKLQSESKRLDALRAAGNIPAYNDAVPSYNQQVEEYNSKLSDYKALVAIYNAKIEQYNQLATRQNDLLHSIDSKFEPI